MRGDRITFPGVDGETDNMGDSALDGAAAREEGLGGAQHGRTLDPARRELYLGG